MSKHKNHTSNETINNEDMVNDSSNEEVTPTNVVDLEKEQSNFNSNFDEGYKNFNDGEFLSDDDIPEIQIPVSIPLQEEKITEHVTKLTLRQFRRKQKLDYKRKKEQEKQLKVLETAKNIIDTTDEKYEKIEMFNPSIEEGLTSAQVNRRRSEGLVNKSKKSFSKSYLNIFCSNIFTFFNFLCVVCAVALALVNAKWQNFVFCGIYVINVAIGIIQEIRSKITMDKMSLVKSPISIVTRDGQEKEIHTDELVLNDVVYLSIGNQVPCDSVILEGSVEVNESMLTGESVAVKKTVGDTLYGGSYISGGNTTVRIERVGDDSYIQRLSAKAKKFKKSPSQLLNAMNTIIKILGLLIIPISACMGVINYNTIASAHPDYSVFEILKEAVPVTATVIIGMIPSGMFLLTSMALAVGVIKLSKHHTSVQDMYALEMLARIDVLCLDKTGTITDGKMKVDEVILLNPSMISVKDIVGSMQNALRDNNMTSIALIDHFGLNTLMIPRTTIPFSSDKKYSAVTFMDYGTYALGAPSYILKKVPERYTKIIQQNTMLGNRVLMLAHSNDDIVGDHLPKDLTPIALIVLQDNIRPDAIKTIKWFNENDVQVKIISGDDPITVSEIARKAGVQHYQAFINLDGLNDKEVLESVNKYTVFGRVSPEQKAILVKALKTHGHTVGMTGDGVNDILAMKEADCSITVASGSDATRNISHIVLMNNDFTSLPLVVNEGRRVINNIQQSSSLYLMKTIFTFLFALINILSYSPYPFETGHMTVLELLVIGIGSFFLSLQPNSDRVKGGFINTIVTNALPGALILIFNMYAFTFLQNLFEIDLPQEMELTIRVLLVTFGGLAYLYRTCLPFDLYKGILFFSVSTLLFIWAAFLIVPISHLESLIPITENWEIIILMVCILQLNSPILNIISSTLNKINFNIDNEL